jgi:hypothetical protein
MKKVIYLLIAVLFVFNCSIDNIEESIPQEDTSIMKSSSASSKKSKKSKVLICHNLGSGFHTIEVSPNALDAHYSHGDINPDKDGDGFTAPFGELNPCHIGDGNDCDDDNPNVNPNSDEICGNAIDENCNGYFAVKKTETTDIIDADCPCIKRVTGMCKDTTSNGDCKGKGYFLNYNTKITTSCEDTTPI